MINPDDPLERQIEKLQKIVRSLMWRVEQNNEKGATPYALFQTAINLENEVHARTADLQAALNDLGKTHEELSQALADAEISRENLLDALGSMSEGFALFANDKLRICNGRFQNLLPDVQPHIVEGMTFADYTQIISRSVYLKLDEGQTREEWQEFRSRRHGSRHASFVVKLIGDRWIQVSDRRMSKGRAAILHTDITEMVREQRKQSDRILDRQARQARATIDHMTQGVCTFDAQNLLAASNSRFRELLSLPFSLGQNGTTLEQIFGYLIESRVLERSSLKLNLIPWINDQNVRKTLQLEVRRSDGVILDASFRKLPEQGFVASFTDVTAERRATEALARAKATLELRVAERTSALTEANNELVKKSRDQERAEQELRIAKEAAEAANLSKTRFLAAASHDLLQPLNAAKLFISSLQHTKLNSVQMDIAASLSRSFNSVETILDALLNISRLDASGAEFAIDHFKVNTLLETLRADFQQIAQSKGVELIVMPTSLAVVSDETYLRRIIQNLLSNAVKYTQSGKVLVGCRRVGGEVSIQVWDTGPGIAEQDRGRIFEEFQRLATDGHDPGMGLGLSFVERACRQLGHKLELHSEVGRGSGFSVFVTRSDKEDIKPPEMEERFFETFEEMDVLVALVENDREVLAAMIGTLERWGMSVLPARSTEELLRLVAEVGVPPDIIVADYHLNGDDTGLQSVVSLRQATGLPIPSILVTADRSKQLQRVAKKMQVEILTKPLKQQALRSLLSWSLQLPSPGGAMDVDAP